MVTIIGEAAKNLSPESNGRHPCIPWEEIAGMRDKIVHHYFGVDYEALYITIRDDIPQLKKNIQDLLSSIE